MIWLTFFLGFSLLHRGHWGLIIEFVSSVRPERLMNRLLEKRNAVINVLTLFATWRGGSAPLPLKIRQDMMLPSQGHTRLVTTNSTQGIPIPILSSATALLRRRGGEGKSAKGRQIKCHGGAGAALRQSSGHHRMLFPKKKDGELTKKTPATTLQLEKINKWKLMKGNTLSTPVRWNCMFSLLKASVAFRRLGKCLIPCWWERGNVGTWVHAGLCTCAVWKSRDVALVLCLQRKINTSIVFPIFMVLSPDSAFLFHLRTISKIPSRIDRTVLI